MIVMVYILSLVCLYSPLYIYIVLEDIILNCIAWSSYGVTYTWNTLYRTTRQPHTSNISIRIFSLSIILIIAIPLLLCRDINHAIVAKINVLKLLEEYSHA